MPSNRYNSGWQRRMAVQSAHRATLIAQGFDPESVIVPGDGPCPAQVMFVGERPGKDEPWGNPPRPFVGAAGKELDRYLGVAGLRRDQVYVTNLVKTYRAGDVDPEDWEVARDADTLYAEIVMAQPDIVVPLGAIATRHFLGDWATMELVSGIPHRPTGNSTSWVNTVLPIIHPAAGLHDGETVQFIEDGFRRLRMALDGRIGAPVDQYPQPIYTQALKDGIWWHRHTAIAIDTEGTREDPICLTYSDWPGIGRLIDAKDRGLLGDFARAVKFTGDEGMYLLHNSLHDLAVLDKLGVHLPESGFIDTMVLAYLLCLEPQGLKALAYRHGGRLRESYDEIVGPANRAKALEYLQMLDQYSWGEAEAYVITETDKQGSMQAKVKRPHSLNRRIARIIGDYGKAPDKVDIRARWGNLVEDNPPLVAKVEDLVGPMPVATLRDVDVQKYRDYACADADDTQRIFPPLMDEIVRMDLLDVMRMDHDVIPIVDRMQRVGMPVVPDHFTDYLEPRMLQEMERIQNDIKVSTGAWINPDSSDQCAALLFDQLGLPWTKWTKGGKRPKCDDKVLEGLRGAHPVVGHITDYRERSKIVTSFCRPIVRFARQSGGEWRVRCNLRITRVSSGRLAANSPNLLAIPVRTSLGLEVRRGFVAPAGRVLSSRDLDQIEMREMAHQSQDPIMLAVFRDAPYHPGDPEYDIHNKTAGMMYGKRARDVTKFERYGAKRIGFGVITGITAVGLKDQMDMAGAAGWTEDDCQHAIDDWFRIYGHVRRYMDNCRAEARRYGYVRDRWGRIRYLPAIHSTSAKIRAEAERQSHSFKISASAQGVMKRAMKLWWDEVCKVLWVQGVGVEPLLQIHDSLLREVDEEWAEAEDAMLEQVMEQADDRMSVPITSKGKWGGTWGELE